MLQRGELAFWDLRDMRGLRRDHESPYRGIYAGKLLTWLVVKILGPYDHGLYYDTPYLEVRKWDRDFGN